MDTNLAIAAATVAAVVVTIFGGQWKLSNWLSRQFSEVKSEMYRIRDELLRKIEYHEEHDDRRFGQIHDDIWTIKVRNAAKDVQMDHISNTLIGKTIAKAEKAEAIARKATEERSG